MTNHRKPSFAHKTALAVILVSTILFCAGVNICSAQNHECDNLSITETDSVTGEKIIRAQKNIIISEDGGKTGFAVFALLMDSTFILTIRTVGGGACVETGDQVHFLFSDSSILELNNMGQFNCEAKSSLYFNDRFSNFDALEMLSEKQLAKVTVWTKKRFVAKKVDTETAAKLNNLLSCFNLQLHEITFSKHNQSKVFVVVEQQPEFVGGAEALLEFLKKNMRYHSVLRKIGINGTVYVQFLVNKDGSITNVKTIRGIHPAADAEAERVIKLMPPWRPGYQSGKPVIVRFIMPIKFKVS